MKVLLISHYELSILQLRKCYHIDVRLTLVDKKQEATDVTTFVFKPELLFPWKAGQFLHYTLPHLNPDSRGIERYFTIATAPFENYVMITTRFAEDGSSFKKALKSLKIGGQIEAVGPDGNFTVDDPNQKMVFIAGGIGITPFRSILLDLEHRIQPISVTLLYANKTPDFVYKQELEKIAGKNPSFKIHYFVDPQRIDENSIKKIVKNLQKPIFFVSGPVRMADGLGNLLKEIGVPKSNIKKDFFPGYD